MHNCLLWNQIVRIMRIIRILFFVEFGFGYPDYRNCKETRISATSEIHKRVLRADVPIRLPPPIAPSSVKIEIRSTRYSHRCPDFVSCQCEPSWPTAWSGGGRNGLVNVDTRRHCLCSSIMTTCATAANFLENDRAQTSATVYDCTIFSCDPSYDLNYDRNELRVVSPARLFADGSAYAPVRAFGACPVDGVSPNRPNSNGNALFTGRLMRTIV